MTAPSTTTNPVSHVISENIFIDTSVDLDSGDVAVVDKKKRGRKRKILENTTSSPEDGTSDLIGNTEDKILKKRGRKPKGGKLIFKSPEIPVDEVPVTNIILHLKCSIADLNEYNDEIIRQNMNPHEYNPSIPPEIKTYNTESGEMLYEYNRHDDIKDIAYNDVLDQIITPIEPACHLCGSGRYPVNSNRINNQDGSSDIEYEDDDDTSPSMRDISHKLKKLKLNLFKNTLSDKKSACFWCTCDFDNPECYIPKYELDDTIFGYGSFCRPECAVAYLMKESIDDSAKFERYHLLNRIYSKVYNFKKNIKPAPNPYYILDKFYGNLSIQEYRKLLKSEHMLLVIDKPLTRILPELHEDTEDFTLSINGSKNPRRTVQAKTNSGQMVYKVKRQSDKQVGPSKSSIMREQFGL